MFTFLWALLLTSLCIHLFRRLTKVEVIKGAGKAIYTLEDGVKHLIPDWNTFVSMGFGASDIKSRPEEEVRGYPEGDSVGVIVEAEELKGQSSCPCWTSTAPDMTTQETFSSETSQIYQICIVNNSASSSLLSMAKLYKSNWNYRLVHEGSVKLFLDNDTLVGDGIVGCDVLVRPREADLSLEEDLARCPGICKSVPLVEIPLDWLQPPFNLSHAVTCSLTISAISAHSLNHSRLNQGHHHNQNDVKEEDEFMRDSDHTRHLSAGHILKAIVHRRLEECREKGSWPRGSWATNSSTSHFYQNDTESWSNTSYLWPHKSSFTKRAVYGVILWIGSTTRLGLSKMQLAVLRSQPADDDKKILGWIASEHLYSCRVGKTLCEHLSPNLAYYRDMPSSILNVASAGYSCAQRRALRAMSHTLLLFDPDFLLVVDDDTYVNTDLLNYGTKLSTYILQTMSRQNIVLGQLSEGKKITVKGFYYGGAGYLMGRAVLDRLNAYTLHGPSVAQDTARNAVQMKNLALLEQAVELGKSCPHCVRLGPDGLAEFGAKATLAVRLIELCQNIMSEEKTCYHSDHAITRCLIHGAYSNPINVRCWGVKISSDPDINMGMCMYPDDCQPDTVLTCHRRMPNTSDSLLTPIAATWNDSMTYRII